MWCHFKVGSLGGNIRSWRWSLQDEISTLIKRDMQSCFLSHYQMKIQRHGLLWTRNLQGLHQEPHHPCTQVSEFQIPKLWEICLLFKPHHLWYFCYSNTNQGRTDEELDMATIQIKRHIKFPSLAKHAQFFLISFTSIVFEYFTFPSNF